MLDLYLDEELKLKAFCKEKLDELTDEEIIGFSKQVFPIQTAPNPIDVFYHNLWTFYSIRVNKNMDFELINKEILKKAEEADPKISKAISALVESPFIETFKKRLTKGKQPVKTNDANNKDKSVPVIMAKDSTNRKVVEFTSTSSTPAAVADNKSVTSNDSFKNSMKSSVIRPSIALPSIAASTASTTVTTNPLTSMTSDGTVINLSDQDMCFCGKHVNLIRN